MNQQHALRVALRLQEVLQTRAAREAEKTLDSALSGFHHSLQRLRSCLREHGQRAYLTPVQLHRHLLSLARSVHDASDLVQQDWATLRASVPCLRDVLAELQQLQDEFEDVHFDLAGSTLAVTTEPIELEEIYLGPFAIRLAWRRFAQGDADLGFTVVALDPQPAASDDRITHPHVKEEKLCPGDAKVPLQRAMQQGRLADAFCLIRGVLTHYNDTSPYVRLADWQGQDCMNCGSVINSDDLWYCSQCGNDVCSECTGRCANCEEVRCQSCLTLCQPCGNDVCSNCLSPSIRGEPACCNACRESPSETPDDVHAPIDTAPTPQSLPPLPSVILESLP